ncbi:3-carboxy-cis,cis-muconate cycloisomerase [Ralstonia pseudosolanacearum]|uniref:3-carboxy-cis,cis-muconate cycloisomerase n=1 Tax=Ralstonia pseudosolanacearum TaxID=1310165 RepID=UPI0026761065|nr:3-carboxy-cis,cis-muconate cycloisomerase [Ralstonia pseudosolanacearum]MDO3524320.1 3-carboxy-cis,cis-muconate cycloisomerase [Ralstonia pseudosolanacearum]MDO3548421.1 3-carboxy-cis,cis-muconate cycloisomerase [Ralstonia pseudosolanacearum]MDO3554008.1 3-carboxy-cis,cis-muconate cycloisomerase [Ralstonia pseudosolanacearum]MDO3568417.1 3-carboxy-cis,cis-muconate cycloisomerase [Ralstonia pseudosolanacearum]MDO3583492.1 3-carboxy-cis,cis-muconate cycloisomerase [Ralstonia pseudosolanacearu
MTTGLLDRAFSTPAMLAVWSDAATVRAMLDVEAALAQAEGEVGVIPAQAVAPIRAVCAKAALDLEALGAAAASAGNLAIPLVKQLTAAVAQHDEHAARYVHWGATSQDIIDTGLMLQWRQAAALLDADLRQLADALAVLARAHRDTPMVARTWLQQALPTTFGRKVASWLEAVHRAQDRFAALRAHVPALQFGGAAGTLASLGAQGRAVAQALAQALDLPLPAASWHGEQDRIADIGATLALLTGTLGHMARDLSLMMQTEVGEAAEPAGAGKGGSSTMPHKRNPVGCATVLAAATRLPGLAATLLAALPQEHERALGGWQAQWATLREMACLTAGALDRMRDIIGGLDVDPARMRANLDLTRGLILGEAVMLALGADLGRLQAHHVVEAASRKAVHEDRTLRDVLAEDADVLRTWGDAVSPRLDALLDPTHYLGDAAAAVDRVLAEHDSRRP